MSDTAELPQFSHAFCNVSVTGEERLPAFAAGGTAASSNAGSLSPNSVFIVIPIPVVPAHEEDCALAIHGPSTELPPTTLARTKKAKSRSLEQTAGSGPTF